MAIISISNLKTHLCATLKEVVGGIRYIVMDRDHPIAELVPFQEKQRLIVILPQKKSQKIKNMFKGRIKSDALEYLLEDRRGNR